MLLVNFTIIVRSRRAFLRTGFNRILKGTVSALITKILNFLLVILSKISYFWIHFRRIFFSLISNSNDLYLDGWIINDAIVNYVKVINSRLVSFEWACTRSIIDRNRNIGFRVWTYELRKRLLIAPTLFWDDFNIRIIIDLNEL